MEKSVCPVCHFELKVKNHKAEALQKQIDALKKERNSLRFNLIKLINNLGVCDQFDHHGNCQTHFIESPCTVILARQSLNLAPAPNVGEKSNG